jgi:hypothetical protein
LAKVFRAKFLDAFSESNLKLPANYPKKWVANCKNVGRGRKALLYLSKYLYRGVISEKNILASKNGKVTFQYINSNTNKFQTKTVSATYFLWLVLQHVLPRGFRRARNYGFLHPNSKNLTKIIHRIFRMHTSFGKQIEMKPRPKMICPCCGASMQIVKTKLKISRRLVPT